MSQKQVMYYVAKPDFSTLGASYFLCKTDINFTCLNHS